MKYPDCGPGSPKARQVREAVRVTLAEGATKPWSAALESKEAEAQACAGGSTLLLEAGGQCAETEK